VGTPNRFTYDYKPAHFGRRTRPIHRLPWFIAGIGIPLLCLGFIAPKNEPTAALAPAEVVPDDVTIATTANTGPTFSKPADEVTTAVLPGKELRLKVRTGDSLDRMFGRNDLSRSDLAGIMALEIARQHLRLVKPGDEILIRQDAGRILQLNKPIGINEALSIQRIEDRFQAEVITRELDVHQVRTAGGIDSSLFLAAAEAGISDRTIMNLAGIFAWDVDFMLDIRAGDEFTLIYEELWLDGKMLAEGQILAAEFVNQGESYRAVRFEDAEGRVDYFTPDGRSVRKAFVRAPLSFSRISSNFNPRRRHPRLNTIRAHHGVDYAAPSGTPIRAAGDGKIVRRGRQGGYGNVVILQHGGNITTLYAHLSRFSSARDGGRVRQGDVIGYVGSTGLATGPHLHYEYRRNGVHLNPRTVDLPDAEPIDPKYLEKFRQTAEPLLHSLDQPRNLFAAGAGNTTS